MDLIPTIGANIHIIIAKNFIPPGSSSEPIYSIKGTILKKRQNPIRNSAHLTGRRSLISLVRIIVVHKSDIIRKYIELFIHKNSQSSRAENVETRKMPHNYPLCIRSYPFLHTYPHIATYAIKSHKFVRCSR